MIHVIDLFCQPLEGLIYLDLVSWINTDVLQGNAEQSMIKAKHY